MVAEISQFLLGSNIPTCLTSFSFTCPFSSVSVPHTSFASPPGKVLEFCCTLPPFSSFLCVLPYRHLVSYYLVIVACGENPEYLAAPDQLRSHTRAGRLQFRQLYLIDWVIRGRIGIGIGFNPLQLEVFRVSMRC